MQLLSSHKSQMFSLHFLPLAHFRKFENSSTPSTSSSSSSSFDDDYSPSHPKGKDSESTIHHRRTMSKSKSKSGSPPPTLNGFADFFHSRTSAPIPVPKTVESDAECWTRMLMLQKEYHCYKSARLEAAVEAMEMGVAIEELPMPPRLCLNLLNEELRSKIEAYSQGLF